MLAEPRPEGALARAGLVQTRTADGARQGGLLVRATAPELALRYDPAPAGNARAVGLCGTVGEAISTS